MLFMKKKIISRYHISRRDIKCNKLTNTCEVFFYKSDMCDIKY